MMVGEGDKAQRGEIEDYESSEKLSVNDGEGRSCFEADTMMKF